MTPDTSAELVDQILVWLENYATTPGAVSNPTDDAFFLLLATLKGDLQYVSSLAKSSLPARNAMADGSITLKKSDFAWRQESAPMRLPHRDSEMAKRYYTCDCGHRVRFTAARCGGCWTQTPLLNRGWVWVGGGALLLTILSGVLIPLAVLG